MGIPLQDQVDMSDRVEAIKVGLVAAGGITFPSEDVLGKLAEHLAKFGCTWQPELQTIWYRPPRPGAGWLEQGQGRWVTGEAPGVPPADAGSVSEIDAMIAALSPEQRAMLSEKLGGEGGDAAES